MMSRPVQQVVVTTGGDESVTEHAGRNRSSTTSESGTGGSAEDRGRMEGDRWSDNGSIQAGTSAVCAKVQWGNR